MDTWDAAKSRTIPRLQNMKALRELQEAVHQCIMLCTSSCPKEKVHIEVLPLGKQKGKALLEKVLQIAKTFTNRVY